jgi:hypothetical protein
VGPPRSNRGVFDAHHDPNTPPAALNKPQDHVTAQC